MDIFDMKEAAPAVLDAFPVETLMHLQAEAEKHAASSAQIMAVLHSTLCRRYAAGLNDTGTHNRQERGIDIKITIPKTVAWDQEQLTKAVETIKGWGENPADYVDVKLSVSETKFKAWPPAIRDLFAPARTVKAGKPKFEFSTADAGARQEAA
jgi:hypothetical protein